MTDLGKALSLTASPDRVVCNADNSVFQKLVTSTPRGKVCYNAGDMLFMTRYDPAVRADPRRYRGWAGATGGNGDNRRHREYYRSHGDTIAGRALANTPPSRRPSPDHMRAAADNHIIANDLQSLRATCSKETTLFVHVRTGDQSTDDLQQHLDRVKHTCENHDFTKIYFMLGLHPYQPTYMKSKTFPNTAHTVNTIMNKFPECSILLGEPDHHLCIMRCAANLFLHKMGFSALGGILCQGRIFVPPTLAHAHPTPPAVPDGCPSWRAVLNCKTLIDVS